MTMTPELWQKVSHCLAELLEMDARQRAAALTSLRQSDPELAAEVESLLRQQDTKNTLHLESVLDRVFAEVQPAEAAVPTTAHSVEESLPNTIGPYKLLQKLGQGGMGEVWLAEQTVPVQRRVALKIIQTTLHGDEAVARFDIERQALAMMDHPNIAKVLDAGATVGGRPYFVMELVKGIPFGRFCDQEKLTLKERLELFIQVCNAVQHAHQKGIIHRDLKPSNVLVGLYDGRPVPKVIDFGLAKALHQKLTDKSLFTDFGRVMGTLEYMAPEQAKLDNLDVDTRADIYSLGVMLYETLSGGLPLPSQQLREATLDEVLRRIREVEPPKPSSRLAPSEQVSAIADRRKIDAKKLSRLVKGDLDWITMKCLEKERGRRYETANQLGQELQRFLTDEPVQAGPPSVGYRIKKFLRRNKGPVLAASLVVVALVAGFVGTSIGLVLAKQAAEREQLAAQKLLAAAEKEREHELQEVLAAEQKKRDHERTEITVANMLEQAVKMRRQYSFKQARDMLTHAQRLAGPGNPALLRQVQTALEQLNFAEQLDRIRQDKALTVEGKLNYAAAAPKYVTAFLNHGLDILHGDEAALSGAVIRSPLRDELLAALDDWLGVEPDSPRRQRLCQLTVKITGHAWRDALAAKWDDPKQLTKMLNEVAPQEMTVALLVSVCARISFFGGDSAIWMDRARLRAPGDFWIWYELGWANYIKGKEYARMSAQAYHGCLAIRPDNAAAWHNLGVVLSACDNLPGAIAALDTALKLDPKFALAFNNHGHVWFEKKEHDKAIQDYDEAIRLNPKFALAYNDRGCAWAAKKEYDKAIKDYDEAIRLEPKYARAFNNRGSAWANKKEYDKAIKDHDEALRLEPKFALAFHDRGRAWYEKKDYDKAIKDYDEAIQLEPKNAPVFHDRGCALGNKKEYDRAIKEFDEALRLDPSYALVFGNRGCAWANKKEYEKAIKDFDAAIRLEPKNALAYGNRGHAWYEKKDYDMAIKDYDEAIRLETKDALVFNNRGIAWANKQEYEKAIKDFDEAIRLEPKNALAYCNRANVWYETKEYAKAIKDCDEAMRLDPQFAGAYSMQIAILTAAKQYLASVAAVRNAEQKLAREAWPQLRYNAACTFVLAGCGSGDAAKLTEKERKPLREQALAWLREELAGNEKLAALRDAASRGTAVEWFRNVKQDNDFDGVRDAKALARLDEPERMQWQQFWQAVDAALKK